MTYVWIAAIVVFAAVEAATVSLVSIWFVGGALAGMITALLGGSVGLQLGLFVLVSAVLLACLRPFLKKYVTPKKTATNVESLIGQQALVAEPIDNLKAVGAVRINGNLWTARSADGSRIPAGALVKILRIEGVKVFVELVKLPAEIES